MSDKSKKAPKSIKPPDLPDDFSSEGLAGGTIRDRERYEEIELSQADLSGQSADYVSFEAAIFSHVRMMGCNFPGLGLLDVRLQECDLANAGIYKANLQRVEILASRLVEVKASEVEFQDVVLKGCKAGFALFRQATFKSVRFEDCDLSDADLMGADLSGAVFSGCDLSRCDLSGAKLAGTDFRGSNLESVKVGIEDLRGAIVDPTQALEFVRLLGVVVKAEGEWLNGCFACT